MEYTCFRCNYTTKEKFKMKRHFERTTKCPALNITRNIELTDEIKNYILENRVYQLPNKKVVLNKLSKNKNVIVCDSELHYIYLLRPRENVIHNENVYKIGKTVLNEFMLSLPRVTKYGRGSELISINQCIDAHNVEKEILNEFNNVFTRHTYGDEYFIGDPHKMNRIISNIIDKNTLA